MAGTLTYVMSVLCDDRPGQVERVATVIAESGGNWLESRMCRLGGRFAGILRVSIPDDKGTGLMRALNALESSGISVVVQSDQPDAAENMQRLITVHLVGQDRPGIVRQISQAIARAHFNVEDMRTGCRSAPWSGETLFEADILLNGADGDAIAQLQRELERIGGDLMVDIEVEELAD